MQGDARIVLPAFFPEGTFERVYVLFPDPWPKRRHTGMRLLGCEFLGVLARLLRPGGELVLGTDAQDYLVWVMGNVRQVPALQDMANGPSDAPPTSDWVPTFYEEKWRAEGRPIRFLTCRRI
jgi:tRNA (guanine-N7-)-methyltransferase